MAKNIEKEEQEIENGEKLSALAVAHEVQENNEGEADAIKDYTRLLDSIDSSELDETDKEFCTATINEIVADEMNHQEKLAMLYSMLTGIMPNKD